MKLVFAAIVAWMPLLAADKPAAQPAARTQTAAPQMREIPAGAVRTGDGWWRHTDADGKKWLYRKTPFGVARREDDGKASATEAASGSASAGTAARSEVTVTATEDKDTVHFEKPGPFGIYRWDRKKSELSADERGWLEASRHRDPAKSKQE